MVVVFMCWACKNNGISNPVSTNNNNNGFVSSDYFPLAIGNWWLYANYDLDSNGIKVPGSDKMERDSIVDTTTVQGRLAYTIHTYIDSTFSMGYFSYDGSGNLLSFIDTSSGQGRGFWMTLAEFSDSTYGQSATFYTPITYSGIPLIDTTQETYYGIVSTPTPMQVFSARYYYDTVHSSVNYIFASGSVNGSNKSYYAKGVGRVKEVSSTVVKSTVINKNSGTYAELISYSVK
jgi:type II secretory pathway pseudopilin PulG